jgi:hypothetical protein
MPKSYTAGERWICHSRTLHWNWKNRPLRVHCWGLRTLSTQNPSLISQTIYSFLNKNHEKNTATRAASVMNLIRSNHRRSFWRDRKSVSQNEAVVSKQNIRYLRAIRNSGKSMCQSIFWLTSKGIAWEYVLATV